MTLKEKIKSLPLCPGVYLMKDKMENIIYVGKSKSLRKRVKSYFVNNKNHSPKTLEMVSRIEKIEYITTDTEFEALLLECKLIKEIRPMYNRLIKNSNKYQYIKITINEKIPRVLRDFEKNDDGSFYFGPFSSRYLIDDVISILKKYFKLRVCDNLHLKTTVNGCIYYQINKCIGPCINGFEIDTYKENIIDLVKFLNGESKELFNKLNKLMKEKISNLEFENAKKINEELKLLKYFVNSQNVINETIKRKNIIIFEKLDSKNIKIFLIRGNKVLINFKVSLKDIKNVINRLVNEIIKSNKENILITKLEKEEINEAKIIYSYLKENKNSYIKIDDTVKNEKKIEKLLSVFIEKFMEIG